MATVYLCNSTNSTMFTTCCNVAICDDQKLCPKCGDEVVPRTRAERWRTAYGAATGKYGRHPVNGYGWGNWYPNHGK